MGRLACIERPLIFVLMGDGMDESKAVTDLNRLLGSGKSSDRKLNDAFTKALISLGDEEGIEGCCDFSKLLGRCPENIRSDVLNRVRERWGP